MATRPAHFISDPDGAFHPTENARSRWGEDMLNGPAVVGLAAWNLEQRFSADGFLPARLTVDLFKAARKVPTTVRSRLVRDGHRIRNAECEVVQGEVTVARATLVQCRQSQSPPGQEWVGDTAFDAPPTAPQSNSFLIGSDEQGWLPNGAAHQNTSRKRVYHNPIDVVAGHNITPFVRTVVVAEATSLVSNLGTKGIGYINGDLTVALSRLPQSEYIGIQGDSHWACDGISVGTGTLFDEAGPFGSALVTAIANPAAQIDFGRTDAVPGLSV
ncbi:thioesterase family protein [Mycolicibacterium sp. CH28]|uniref:acyl-CoA thioesterase domain-containing protein n=1 Tax=Mycolicibacterium sp. CH28 TaxID=2512237 RepID=UPI0010819F59|nr:acyl-CoA thioesterase domain-containing protein [Mycolicibacterium sp. CH28]TGD88460.1 thioesterase family protein [Mycolicibacterium sp. CH28]